jgi:hypothetical protein
MQVCVIVPTTDGPAPILRLTRLAQAPRSVMRTQDDYRPLPPSARYHAFVQVGGALANRIGYGAGQFELMLGGMVETGRSWELPAAIAHWLHEQGHELGTDAPDLLVWATGALDNDLYLLQQDYHLARKLDESAACLQEALRQTAPCRKSLNSCQQDGPWPSLVYTIAATAPTKRQCWQHAGRRL